MNIYENLPLTPNDMFSMMTWVLIGVLIWFIFDFISGDKY